MAEPVSAILTPWTSFYIVTGSSAAALTGLMFVVITLVMGTERVRRNPDGTATFSTPTVFHFCAALFVSAVLIAPWHSFLYPGIVIGLGSLYALFYIGRVALRSKRFTEYTPDFDDWTWYSVLPFVAYIAILIGSIGLEISPHQALFALAFGVLLLVLIGIRNAWDVVTFLAIGGPEGPPQ
ncbi:MAG TPA: hypothetical protein VGI19_08080 [Candidatus Cybelea sp.]